MLDFPEGHAFHGLRRNHYKALLVDPPWPFKSRTALQVTNWNSRRDVEKHYPVMTIEEICALPVGELAARDAHLFLWVTGPNLFHAKTVIEAWGFKYSSKAFTWIKLRRSYDAAQLRFLPTAECDLHIALGLTTRKNSELCLLARRGNARRISKSVREVILAPVRQHSRKPDEVYGRIESYCAGPYLELFARQRWPGWTAWGWEKSKFNSDAGNATRAIGEAAE